MKKFIVLIITFLLVLFIYVKNKDDKVYYLSLGDSYAASMNYEGILDYGYSEYIRDYLIDKKKLEKFVNCFAKSGYRTIDLLRDITDNKVVDNISIKQALIKADLVTLAIGTNDILSMTSLKMNDECINEAMVDLDNLLKTIREYCKEKIIVIGYFDFGNNEISDYANKKYKELCEKYNIIYIDVFNLTGNSLYFPDSNNIHPSKEGYKAIFDKIKESLDSF